MVFICPILENGLLYVHFGVKKWNLYSQEERNVAHLEKYSRSQLGHILKHDSRKDQNELYKIWE